MAELFGFEFRKKRPTEQLPSFTPKETDDGAVVVAAGGAFGTYVDLDGTVRTEAELVTKYREMALQPECDSAIDEIVNESFSIDEETIIDINLDDPTLESMVSPQIRKLIQDEFKNCLRLLDFNKYAYDIYRRWYIDGRLYYHTIVDEKNPTAGVKELRYVDPRKIRKVREVSKQRINAPNNVGDALVSKTVNEYFIFNDKGFNYGNKTVGPSTSGLKIAKDSILHVVSGLTDNQGTMVLSYLHKGIKALNQLRTLEDALVIYRLARAPERRIWYIDVGNLPKMKAEQYVRDIMVKYKNKLAYDSSTGEIRDDRKFTTMLEDFWVPRREGGRGTEISTLPGASNIDQVSDLTYFKDALYNSLNIPINRTQSDSPFIFGETDNITKAEVKFFKSIQRMRVRFQGLFLSFLEKQLILKNIMTFEDWEKIKQYIKFDYTVDNFFAELKQGEILKQRINIATMIEPYIGKYYSEEFVRRNILQQSDDDIALIDSQIELDRQKALERALVQANQDSQVSLVTGRAQMQLQAEQMQMINPSEQEKSPVSAKK